MSKIDAPTEGPYEARAPRPCDGGDWIVRTEGTQIVLANVYSADDDEQLPAEANARLFASAWEMRGLLREAAERFREYEQHHMAKVTPIGPPGPWRDQETSASKAALAKAERNAEIAGRIEALIAGMPAAPRAADDRVLRIQNAAPDLKPGDVVTVDQATGMIRRTTAADALVQTFIIPEGSRVVDGMLEMPRDAVVGGVNI